MGHRFLGLVCQQPTNLVAKLGDWAAALWGWIVDVTPTVLAKLGEWLNSLAQWLVGNLPSWIANLRNGNGAVGLDCRHGPAGNNQAERMGRLSGTGFPTKSRGGAPN